MADPRKGPRGGRPPPLFLDQTEAPRAEKFFWRPLPPLSQGLDPVVSPTILNCETAVDGYSYSYDGSFGVVLMSCKLVFHIIQCVFFVYFC